MRKLLAISAASVGSVLLATIVFLADGGDHDSAARLHDPTSSDSSTTSVSIDVPTPSTAQPGATRPRTNGAQRVSSNPAAAPRAEPEPLLADGRHPVFLTDIDVDRQTVEFDLVQYLTGAEQEAYEAAHPTD